MISFFEKTKASISVFLILVLFPMYTCAYLAIDSARYSAAKAKVGGAMELTGNAALAEYDKTFKELYGIFVMSESIDDLEDNLVSYYSNTIDSTELGLGDTTLTRKIISGVVDTVFENTVNTKTKDFSASYVSESAIYNPSVMEDYMKDYMKYSAPVNWTKGFSKKLEAFIDVASLSKTKESIEVEESGEEEIVLPNNETSIGAKEQIEQLNEIANTDVESTYSSVDNLDIPSLVSASILKTISLETVDEDLGVDDFSALSSAIYNAYEMEYIASQFSCLSNQTSSGPVKMGEIEYIVFGKDNLATNVTLSIDLIFALRVIFNTVYVYTNSTMRQSALALATATAGWTGVGIPLAQNAILIAWAMAESVLDVSSLCKGETVPIYKSSATWTLSLQGVSNTLAKGATNYACKTIDDIFSQIESTSLENLDTIEDAALNYMLQTGQGVIEGLTSEIVTSVEKKITSLTCGTKTDYTKEELNALLLEAVNSVEGDSAGLSKAKELFITYCLPTITDKLYENLEDVFSGDETISNAAGTAISNAIDDAYSVLFSKLEEVVDGYTSTGEEKLSLVLEKASDKVKEEAIEIIEDYQEELSEFIGGSDTASVSTSSGLGMTYVDYLRLFLLIRLCSNTGKSNIMKRCSVIMQINCQNEDSEFNITKCYTQVKINTTTSISNHEIESSKIYEY